MKHFVIKQYGRARLKARRKLLGMVQACRDVTPLMSQSLDRPLSHSERLSLRLHLLVCVWCSRYLTQLTMMRELLQHEEPSTRLEGALSADARARFAEQLRNKAH